MVSVGLFKKGSSVSNVQQNNSSFSGSVVSLLASTYGPYAFGVVSLLIVWFAIVKPELQRSVLDFTAMQSITSELRMVQDVSAKVSHQQEMTAKTMERTAELLQQIVGQLKER
jgi:hypothetical protein